MSIAFFDVDETLITGKSMFLFLHRYAEEYPLQCGLTTAAIVRQLQALSKAGQPREAINRYYYSLFRHEPRAQVRAVAEALYREGGYGFHREVVAILRQHQARGG
ncbi:haloacid dehalogenase-like hydrolase [Klebsiella variicola subsp. variicola]|nr:haloacid dehalogenase-like hydrolase [Klebsiella variicola subsp. variicola]